MRFLCGVLLIAASVIHVFLGGAGLVRYKYEVFMAKEAHMVKTEDLSAVAGDLVDDQTKEKEASASEVDLSAATRQLVIGILMLVLALAQLVAGILILLGRGRIPALVLVGLSLVGLGSAMVINGLSLLGAIGGAVAALGLATALMVKPKPKPA
jgi:hypothetical protein